VRWSAVGSYVLGCCVALGVWSFTRYVPSTPIALLLLGLTPFMVRLAPKDYRPNPESLRQGSIYGVACMTLILLTGVAGPLLDHSNLIDGRYDLEVSSPGAERPLRTHGEYQRFNGKRVNIRYKSGESETVVEGQLVAVDGAGIAVQSPGVRGRAPVIVHIAWDDVVAGRLAVAI
jgi:hypothetical protein